MIEIFSNIVSELELFFLAGVSIGSIVLIFTIYYSNKKSATNIIFSLLSIFILFWLWSGYIAGLPEIESLAIFFHRLSIMFAALMSALFLLFAHTIPSHKIMMSQRNFVLILLLTAVMAIINISPYAFTHTTDNSGNPIAGLGIIPFAIISTLFSVLAIYFLFKKTIEYSGVRQYQSILILIGISLMLLLLIGTILLPIIIYGNGIFLPLISIYALIFMGITAYAITKYELFNIKIIVTEAVIIVLWIIIFSQIFRSNTIIERAVDSLIFVSILIFGIYLIRSVRREIKQREHIEKLAGELREVNKALFGANEKLKELDKQKTEFVSIASHQLRAPLTAIKGYSSMILEGSFGKVPKKIKEKVDIVFESSQKLVRVIEDFLNITRIELGKMKYELTEFDLKNLTEQVLKEYEATAKNQKIKLSFTADKGEYLVYGDSGKIGQVISNVIDNAIKYTPAGSVKVAVKSGDGKVRIDVTDTGVGLEAEEIEKLFQKFVRADDEGKINVKGTGLGMFVAKQIIEAHQGQIIANSPGKDQGSTFTLELPDAASANREEIKQAGE